MKDQAQLDRIEAQLIKIEDKLDNHLERIAKSETNISSLKWQSRAIFTSLFSMALTAVTMVLRRW